MSTSQPIPDLTRLAKLETVTHSWTLENYLDLQEDHYDSEPFVTNGRVAVKFHLEVYPNGAKNFADSDMTFINLAVDENGEKRLPLKWRLLICDIEGNKIKVHGK